MGKLTKGSGLERKHRLCPRLLRVRECEGAYHTPYPQVRAQFMPLAHRHLLSMRTEPVPEWQSDIVRVSMREAERSLI